MNQSIEQSICEAIDIIVEQAINKAQYDKTIQATIVSCIDQTIGKYKVKYQDSFFYAYATSSDLTYTPNSVVYVLIPNGDMSNEKTIVGNTRKLGINYVPTIEDEDIYEVTGNNCITENNSFELCSYKEKTTEVIYSSKDTSLNKINIDNVAVNEYIKNSKTIKCGATIKTSLDRKQQFQGNYGIIFALDFYDNASEEIVTRNYILDVDKMTGNPYKFINETKQMAIFDIDGASFKEVNYIALICYGFPNTREDNFISDIFIKDLELCGTERLTADEINHYAITFVTPQGTYFDNTNLNVETRLIEAQVRVRGKVVDNDTQKLPFYWFIEHVGITSQSKYYNKYGGKGWKCLNNYNVIKKESETDPAVVEWIPASPQWTVKKSDIIAKEVKYKCVVIYQDTVISDTITIKNLSSNYDITIESDGGSQFYFDIGNPTLTCKVNGIERPDYTYSWAVTDNAGNFTTLVETTDANEEFNNAVAAYKVLQDAIKNEQELYEANKDLLESYLTTIEKYDTIQRVENNKVHHVAINQITTFSTYTCTVYYGSIYLGTTSIVLSNKLELEGVYSLVINNGSYVYKYDENGISPASSAQDNPIDIPVLNFTIYDNLGQPIPQTTIETTKCEAQWIVPTKNTLISIPSSFEADNVNLVNNTKTYKIKQLAYNIADRYNINYNNNDIKLIVKYNGMQLVATTQFTFLKEGDSGTNGTEFTCRIVPNTPSGIVFSEYPMVTESKNGAHWWLNYDTVNSNRFFKAELWHNEERIFSSVTSGSTSEGKTASVVWNILQNKYATNVTDVSTFSVNAATGFFNYNQNGYQSDSPANIVQAIVSYDGVVYYATMPIITVKLSDDDYRVRLKKNTGFREALYTTDGQMPKYNNVNPFELIVERKIDDIWEDVSTLKSDEYVLDYSWEYMGHSYENRTWVKSIHLGDRPLSNILDNQKSVKPLDTFDGECVTNGLQCIISKKINDTKAEVARIHIPIHLLLNRFGNSAINGWDGNSVQINDEGGFILAPQIGAGIKNNDNSFTGVVMGQVKEAGKTNTEIGLFGYASGERSIFLDANTGQAIFGKNNEGQIKLIPGGTSTIAGWKINTDRLESNDGKTRLYADEKHNGERINVNSKFIVYSDGDFKAANGKFTVDRDGNINATGGHIGGWYIDKDYLSSNGITLESKSNGSIYHTGGKWSINGDGSATFQNVTATGGQIGGWTIGATSLQAQNIILDSYGSIRHTGGSWAIYSDGSATFANIFVTGGSIGIGNSVISVGTGGFSFTNPSTSLSSGGAFKMTAANTSVGNKPLNDHIKDLFVENLHVGGTFTINDKELNWQAVIAAITGISLEQSNGSVTRIKMNYIQKNVLGYGKGSGEYSFSV